MSLLKGIIVGITLLPAFLMFWKQKKHNDELKIIKNSSDEEWYEFIFITNENTMCSEHLKEEVSCGEKCSHNYLEMIRKHLRSAQTSVSMCVYHVTLRSILAELLEVYKRQVTVRIISDREMAHHSSSIMKELIEIGITVKVQPDNSSLMHHKFVLIDEHTDKQEVWFGSLNLTGQGLTTNWDNMICTNNSLMITGFSKCFEMLWESFDENI